MQRGFKRDFFPPGENRAHLLIDGTASGMGDLPAVASGEGWVLPMSDGLAQIHGQDARATTDIQTPVADRRYGARGKAAGTRLPQERIVLPLVLHRRHRAVTGRDHGGARQRLENATRMPEQLRA